MNSIVVDPEYSCDQIYQEPWDDLDVVSNNNNSRKDTKRKKGVRDPYTMNRHNVRMRDFRDARIYDPDAEEGFEVQHWYMKKMYNEWLRSVREISGWESFRRAPKLILEEVEREDGSTYIIKKLVPYKKAMELAKNAGKNQKPVLTSQSKDRGVRPDDQDYRPRMFTDKMGKIISQQRHHLNMTQADLAKMINVDTATIRNIEIGGMVSFNPEDMMVKSLAKALKLPSIKYQES